MSTPFDHEQTIPEGEHPLLSGRYRMVRRPSDRATDQPRRHKPPLGVPRHSKGRSLFVVGMDGIPLCRLEDGVSGQDLAVYGGLWRFDRMFRCASSLGFKDGLAGGISYYLLIPLI